MKQSKKIQMALGMIFAVLAISTGRGQEWARFRGPNGQGISDAKTIPVQWAEEDYNWKTSLPAGGHSSPVIWGDKIFITSGDENPTRGILMALRMSDGAILWQKDHPLTSFRHHKDNCLATGTPAVDAERVYAVWPTADKTSVVAFNHEGQKIWEKGFPGVHSVHGPGNSIIVVRDMVVFSLEQETNSDGVEGAWFALDSRTGETRWQRPRGSSGYGSYSTPCLYQPEVGAEQLIFNSRTHGVTGVDPATGAVLWAQQSVLPERVVSSPVLAGNLVIASCGKGSGGVCLVAVRAGESDSKTVYEAKGPTAPYVPTPLFKDGLLFTFHDRGDVGCLDAATGRQIWVEKPGGRFYASPVWVDGRLYAVTREGTVLVLRAGREYELLATNVLGETSYATPAIADGRMIFRTWSHVISIGGPGK